MFLDSYTSSFCHPEQTEDRIEGDELDDFGKPSSTAPHSSSSPASHVLLLSDGAASTSRAASSSLCCPSFGSRAVLRHFLIHCLRSTSIERVVILSLIFPHSHYSYLASHPQENAAAASAKQKLTIIDAVSNLTFPPTTSSDDASTAIVQPISQPNTAYQQHLTCTSLSSLLALQTALVKLLPSDRSHSVLVVDGLSTLFLYHSPPSILRWLLALRALPQLSLLVHADYACHDALADAISTAALHRIAGTRITTTAVRHEKVLQHNTPVTAQASDTAIHTTITAHITHTRSSGRTATKQEHYLLQPNSLTLSAASHTAAAAASATQQPTDAITATLSSLMVDPTAAATERQRQAKAALILPYAHTGDMRVGYGAGGLEVRRVEDVVGAGSDDDLLDDDEEEDDDVDDDLDI